MIIMLNSIQKSQIRVHLSNTIINDELYTRFTDLPIVSVNIDPIKSPENFHMGKKCEQVLPMLKYASNNSVGKNQTGDACGACFCV